MKFTDISKNNQTVTEMVGYNQGKPAANVFTGRKPAAKKNPNPFDKSADDKKSQLQRIKDAGKKNWYAIEGSLDNPGAEDSPVAQAIIRRILLQRTDLLAKYGPEKVGAAVDEVADFVGDVEEIGSSDVSGWIRHVEQMLGNMEQGVAEGSGFDNASPMTKDSVKQDKIHSLKNLIAIAKEQGRQLRVQELELELKKLQGVAEGAEQMTPNWAKYVLDQIYNSNGAVTLTDLFDEGIPGLHAMFMATAKKHDLDPEEDFEDVQHELTVELEDWINGKLLPADQGVAEGLVKDIKRLATGKDVKSRAGQEIAKSQDASMKGDNKTSKKHFDRFDKLDKLANKEQGVAEGPNDGKEDNFTIDDIKNLERIRDFETLKAQAKELIKGKPARRMKPEKISWFYNHIDTLKNPLAVIKMMYDLMLAGEGNKVIGSRNSMSANSYRSKFGEQRVAEGAGNVNVGDDVIITGAVKYKGSTGVVDSVGRDGNFIVVNLYNHGKQSFQSTDVGLNDYAGSNEEESEMQQRGLGESTPRSALGKAIKEGAKVDRMVKHITKSEKAAGKSSAEAEDIAWATANKRGMLDNKNKKTESTKARASKKY